MYSSVSPAQQSTAPPTNETRSVSDVVLNSEAYAALLAADRKSDQASPVEPPNAQQQGENHPTTPHGHPETSITDLVLDNITYDKILSSSAKGLSLDSHQQQPPPTALFGDDARTPPNSPTNVLSNQSLMAASFNIMASETVTRSDIDRTDF